MTRQRRTLPSLPPTATAGTPARCRTRSSPGISASQRYRTSSPATARPTSIRWISLVPSKMVKILAMGVVYAGQRPAVPRDISTDSARPVRDPFRVWAGLVRDWRAGRRCAPVGGRGRPGSWRTPPRRAVRWPDAAGTSQVYSPTDLHLYRFQDARPCGRWRADRPHVGRIPGTQPITPGRTPSRRHGGVTGRTGPSRQCRRSGSRIIANWCGL